MSVLKMPEKLVCLAHGVLFMLHSISVVEALKWDTWMFLAR